MNFTTLNEKINRNKQLDFGDIFSRSFELFKKSWLHGFLFLIISVALVLPAALIIYIPLIAAMLAQDNFYGDQMNFGAANDGFSWYFMGPYILLFIFVMFFVNTVVFALTAGYYRMLRRMDEGEEVSSGEMFVFFKWVHLKKIFVVSLMSFGISLLAFIPGIVSFISFGISLFAMILFYLPVLYIMIPLYFVVVIYAFNDELKPAEIIESSFNIGNRKWLIAFGLIIISSVLAQFVGLLLCGIGLLFTVSFVYNPVYHMYRDVVGFEEEDVEPVLITEV